ncbi:hypothetical protein M0804_009820 [Polistes exclamans]|nr:hypothetical protein M0804_009820 [Polistes exclamans]
MGDWGWEIGDGVWGLGGWKKKKKVRGARRKMKNTNKKRKRKSGRRRRRRSYHLSRTHEKKWIELWRERKRSEGCSVTVPYRNPCILRVCSLFHFRSIPTKRLEFILPIEGRINKNAYQDNIVTSGAVLCSTKTDCRYRTLGSLFIVNVTFERIRFPIQLVVLIGRPIFFRRVAPYFKCHISEDHASSMSKMSMVVEGWLACTTIGSHDAFSLTE